MIRTEELQLQGPARVLADDAGQGTFGVSDRTAPDERVRSRAVFHAAREGGGTALHSVARDHALIDGNERTAWLAVRVFLRFNGVRPARSRHPSPLPARSSGKPRRTTSMYRSSPSVWRHGSPSPDVRPQALVLEAAAGVVAAGLLELGAAPGARPAARSSSGPAGGEDEAPSRPGRLRTSRLSACAGAGRSVECACPGAPRPRRTPRSR